MTMTFLLFIIAAALCLPLGSIYFNKKKRDETPRPTLDDLIDANGEPDNIIELDPLRGNEPDGAILVYADHIIYNGQRIAKQDITDVTFNNAAIPYFPNDYQIVLATSERTLHLPVGRDATWAQEVAVRLKEEVSYHA